MNRTKITELFLLAIASPSFQALDVSPCENFFKQETCLLFLRLGGGNMTPDLITL